MKRLPNSIKRSLWVYHVNTGACNACDIEVVDVLTPYHDAERFGIKLVASPRQADALIITGPVTRQIALRLRRVYEAVPDPKIVIAVGNCACTGGIWRDSYSVLGGVDKVIPVDIYIPGCPPKPQAIIYGIAQALELIPYRRPLKEYRIE